MEIKIKTTNKKFIYAIYFANGAKVAHEKAAAASQQSRRSDKPLNHRATPPVGASSCVFLGGLSRKSVCCILVKKNRPIVDERILDVSSDFLE